MDVVPRALGQHAARAQHIMCLNKEQHDAAADEAAPFRSRTLFLPRPLLPLLPRLSSWRSRLPTWQVSPSEPAIQWGWHLEQAPGRATKDDNMSSSNSACALSVSFNITRQNKNSLEPHVDTALSAAPHLPICCCCCATAITPCGAPTPICWTVLNGVFAALTGKEDRAWAWGRRKAPSTRTARVEDGQMV